MGPIYHLILNESVHNVPILFLWARVCDCVLSVAGVVCRTRSLADHCIVIKIVFGNLLAYYFLLPFIFSAFFASSSPVFFTVATPS